MRVPPSDRIVIFAKTLRGPKRKRENVHADVEGTPAPVIVFTGERRNDLFTVFVKGSAVALTCGSLTALMDLVLARASGGRGFVRLSKMAMCRLRADIDKSLGHGAGKALFETGGRPEYRITIPASNMMAQVTYTPCFAELTDIGVVPKEKADALRRVCGPCDLAVTERLRNSD